MDKARAERIAGELIGTELGGWRILELINHGKSAAVFKAEKSAILCALKVFDPELIERFGEETQEQRINRELLLLGKEHDNLVKILDGGKCKLSGYFFVAMEFIDSPNLASVLDAIPREQIWPIISQIASAARFLENLQIAHRDIKPDNIAISLDFKKAVLLDLGVIRPFKVDNLTDTDERIFLGTLRYSSPEFLFRAEKDNSDGWRALTFYQLGAVLHDMIMQKRLFDEFTEPFARLVEAVKYETPIISAKDVSPDVILLAKNCLSKPFELRLRLVKWEDFEPKGSGTIYASAARERVRKRKIYHEEQVNRAYDEDIEREKRTNQQLIENVIITIQSTIRRECISSNLFPPIEIHDCQHGSSTDAHFVLYITNSEDHGLRNGISVYFRVALLEQHAKIITLEYGAGLYNQRIDPDSFMAHPVTILFEGAFEETVIKGKLHDALYLLLDKAQQIEEAITDKAAFKEPSWIAI